MKIFANEAEFGMIRKMIGTVIDGRLISGARATKVDGDWIIDLDTEADHTAFRELVDDGVRYVVQVYKTLDDAPERSRASSRQRLVGIQGQAKAAE